MKNNEVSALADDVSEIISQIPDKPGRDTGLVKLFIIAFILLLAYLLADKIFGGMHFVSKNGSVNVIGIFYGQTNKKSSDEILVNIGKESSLSGAVETKPINKSNLPKPTPAAPSKPIVKPAPTKLELLSKVALGSTYDQVVKVLGEPSKKFVVELEKSQTGYEMCSWSSKPEIRLMFYRTKLISKVTN
jgi:hypothetical protein